MSLFPSATELELTDSDAWLSWRRDGIGASEAAAALGVSPYTTPLELYSRKLVLLPDEAETFPMVLGQALEPAIATLYRHKTGRPVVRQQIRLESAEHPFLRATLDGVTDCGRVVEFKAIGWRLAREWGESESDEVPLPYLCQVHQQMLVSGAEVADVAVLIGGDDFRVYTVPRDPGVEAMILPKLSAFWDRIVRRDPPPASMPLDLEIISRIAPTRDEAIELDDEALRLADEYARLGDEAKTFDGARQVVKVALIEMMNGHAVASLPDGRQIARKTIDRAGYEVKATSYVDFRIKQAKKARV
jgi:putative phage-type endonuclease